jgi:hypothetical protein
MFHANVMRRTGAGLSLLSLCLFAQPAFASDASRGIEQGQTSKAAFAGAGFRLEFGAKARPPATRLQVGMRSVADGSQSTFKTRTVPMFELGMAGKEKRAFFIAGQSKAEIEQRLNLNGGAYKTATIIFAAGLVVVLVYAVCCLTLVDTD